MSTSVFMLVIFGIVIVFRILMERFCNQTEFKWRLGFAAGMMLCYTVVLALLIYAESIFISEQMSVTDFGIYISAQIFAINLVLIFVIVIYCSTAKKRSLSNREKIKLKDL